ncbi:MAG: hypothetical protein RSE06_04080, partial [Comamonas sp.]
GALKAEWGVKARGAFQALASLKVAATVEQSTVSDSKVSENEQEQALKAPKSDKSAPKASTAQQPEKADQRYTAWS